MTAACLVADALAGEWLLGLFGPEYTVAKCPLVILLATQFLRAVAGPGQSLLMLKKAQGTNAVICLICSVVLLLANAVLIPILGLVGASLAVVMAIGAWVGAGANVLWQTDRERVDLPFLLSGVSAGTASSGE